MTLLDTTDLEFRTVATEKHIQNLTQANIAKFYFRHWYLTVKVYMYKKFPGQLERIVYKITNRVQA